MTKGFEARASQGFAIQTMQTEDQEDPEQQDLGEQDLDEQGFSRPRRTGRVYHPIDGAVAFLARKCESDRALGPPKTTIVLWPALSLPTNRGGN